MPKRKTTLYIDGFNLYYGALKRTPYRWLDPVKMASKIFTKNEIVKTKYFSARVSNMPHDDQIEIRQQTYWRALKSLSNFEIIEGHYKTKEVRAKNAGKAGFTRVVKTEEKGSDVNLASHLLLDAFSDSFEAAIVITGDSDLVTPIQMVRDKIGKTVCLLNPSLIEGEYAKTCRRIGELTSVSSFTKNSIPERVLRNSQLPNPIQDDIGEITKPPTW